MELTRSDVDQILQLIDRADFDVIDIEWKGLKLQLSRGPAAVETPKQNAPAVAPATKADTRAAAAPAIVDDPAPQIATTDTVVPEGSVGVSAPTMGTFYRAPEPGSDPFVTEGVAVKAGDTLGIIEVMKVFSAISAETAGTIREIRAEDGTLVEYGQVLFVIDPDG